MNKKILFGIGMLIVLGFAPFVLAEDTASTTSAANTFSPYVGPQNFDWFLKGIPPPTRPSDFKVRTTGYYFAYEGDYPSWYDKSKDRKKSFYHAVKMEGTGYTKDGKIVWYDKIQPTREASEKYFYDFDYFINKKATGYRPRRTIARNDVAGTPCYIPKWSRVYIKYPQPNHPYTGWYIAEDTGGAFHGKCKIDILLGVGKDSYKGVGNPTVPSNDKSKWPEVWVFPPVAEDKQRAREDNIYVYLDKRKKGLISDGAVAASTTTAATPSASASTSLTQVPRPPHPAFSVPFSIDPSFRVDVPYDFGVYDTVSEQMKNFERCLGNLTCIKDTFATVEKSTPGMYWMAKYGGNFLRDRMNLTKWEQYCESPNENALNSLGEAITECMRSVDNDCVCSYRVPTHAGVPVKDLVLASKDEFGFNSLTGILMLKGSRMIHFQNSGSDVILTLKNPEDSGVKPITVPGVKYGKIDSSLSKIFDEYYGGKDMFWYSMSDDAIVDIYKKDKDEFSIYSYGESPAGDKACRNNNIAVKFCIIRDKKFLAYDADKKKFGVLPIALKFGYLFKPTVKDIKNFEILDAKIAQNKSLLMWDDLPGVDVRNFKVYRFDDPSLELSLKDRKPEDVAVDPAMEGNMTVYENTLYVSEMTDEQKIYDVDPTKPQCLVRGFSCEKDYALKTLAQGIFLNRSLDDEQLYFITKEDKRKYFYLLPDIQDGKDYLWAITAVDGQGKESPSFTFASKVEKSIDDLPPGFARILDSKWGKDGSIQVTFMPPDVNIDDSAIDEKTLEGTIFRAYCWDSSEPRIRIPEGANQISNSVSYSSGTKEYTITAQASECNFGKDKTALMIATVPSLKSGEKPFSGWVSTE